ncbi:ABC transporter substrate-binding protein [Paracoccus luteus]|uniref:ABC transporter substrate-binding protein n=1 Tax=Paracoccus luteus TaxID=2508543 RepID=UPI001FE40B51|nr:ABC transporter substrate-binding protein [Paracoccus luteus]
MIRIGVLRVDRAGLPPISRLELPPPDLGFAGARLAIDDNDTTGRFMGQDFDAVEVAATPETAAAGLDGLLAQDIRFVVVLADAATTLALADRAGDRALILNARAREDALRGADCRANVIHAAPSHAMAADGLAQFLMWKKWPRWFLVTGSHPEDQALADAYRRAATKFGAKIVEERVFEDTGGARRTDSGHVQVQAQIPVFTQRAPDYDIMITADEAGIFAGYMPYHTWDPRPVAGSAGLVPRSWHPAMEAWGATQFQNRFEALAARPMREEDYQTWIALRMVGEAATRARSADPDVLRDFILSPDFNVAGFKGQKLTVRDWDHQLRQPILLTTGLLMASVSPQDAYLHQVTALDTLGIDRPETACKL